MNELEGFAHEMYYIPGNHDPLSLFGGPSNSRDAMPILTTNHQSNVHRGMIFLKSDLILLGLGGSVQDFEQSSNDLGEFSKLKPCWTPFPYTEQDYSRYNKELEELWFNANIKLQNK